ncbi:MULTISPECIES: large conductance mechanosensitive channel protein MscL [Mesoflavibacter]|uniref:Large-conductance mechanosensitive channel n=1 Tax=Mesoflavibacter profundi TaxID=2708110 RepID=A0ABT4RWM6_9FLAO|nr:MULTISPECIES: large conductance mechanosensitive channel protein MscL [Mesoflavibacter]MDA0176227.1 large conductance mechanosensitive channel protein MscL [Mesoflavibacter profundi]QIJ89863.1 Large-conductance mechanosensitive channel [Mesoflavibacter sp. HG96]QIJ92591.1 Large-conductance mechanosensitive channel [Mesoflavibacter sp. HG37]
MKFIKEFKEFAVKGNMMDMAIGIIIGASFNKVIDVLVKKVFMPPLSLMTDGLNFQNKKYILREAVTNASGEITTQEVAVYYGELLEAFLDFLIVGLTVFIVVKGMNKLRTRSHDTKDKTVTTPKDIELLSKLSDLMEEQNELLKTNSDK